MNFNVQEKWGWLVDLKEMQKQTKTVAQVFYFYKRKQRKKKEINSFAGDLAYVAGHILKDLLPQISFSCK